MLLRCGAPFISIHGRNPGSSSATNRSRLSATSLDTGTPLVNRLSVVPSPKIWQFSPCNRRYHAIARPRAQADVQAPIVQDVNPRQSWHSLPSGLRLEVLSLDGNGDGIRDGGGKAPLVFVHGSYHAAWCWGVHWLPYFAALGYDCYAVSLLGQGGSDAPAEPGTIVSHARDVAHFVKERCGERKAVLVGHSFGGLIVQYYLSQVSSGGAPSNGWGEPFPPIAGAVLACSVPPTGNSAVVKRFLLSKPIASIKVTLSLAAKMFATSVPLCRETFFSPSMPEEDVARYQTLMKESSKVPLFDLRKLNASLPVPPPMKNAPPVLVLGAENDFILDKQGIEETAGFLGTKEVIVAGMAHDVMLDVGWRDAAGVIQSWFLTQL